MKCEVTATGIDDGGFGVGTSDGRRVHVADLLPGERAEVAIDHVSPHRSEAWGRIVRRLGPPSADRVTPGCPAFGRCGGCAWQHLAYPAQLAAKRARAIDALAEVPAVKAGAVTVAAIRASPDPFGYRNKGKYVVARSGEGLVLGAYAPRSHNVVDTLGCRVVAPVIDEIATWIRGAAEQAELIAYDERTRTGELRYAIIREVAGDVMIVLVVTSTAPRSKLNSVANALSNHAAVRGLISIANDRRDGAIVPSGSAAHVLLGHGHLVERFAGVDVEVGASEFLQVNRAQAAAMYARIVELAGELKPRAQRLRAVELFCGIGGIALHLARAGAEVVAVELDRDSVAQLRRAANRAGLPVTPLASDAGNLAPEVRAQLGSTPDLVVVNPPRKGLGGALDVVLELAPPMIIYVSCGPTSLGSDLAKLATAGWTPNVIEPFDLMPGTAQVEVVVRLTNQAALQRDPGRHPVI